MKISQPIAHGQAATPEPSWGAEMSVEALREARQRLTDTWGLRHEMRVREVADAVAATAAAWAPLGPATAAHLQALRAGGDGPTMIRHLRALEPVLAPREGPAPDPTGPRAAAAVDARNAMTELLYDLY
ncbi:hypothetical protein [Streptomyces xanthophaeus]